MGTLAKAIQDNYLKGNDTQSYTTIDELIKKIDMITYDKTIHFNEWKMVENEKSKKGNKISRKVPLSLKSPDFGRYW